MQWAKCLKPLKFQAKTPQSLKLRGFYHGPSGGIYAGAPAPAEVSRAPFSVALERSLFEAPPELLTTLAPSRVQIPLFRMHREREGTSPSLSLWSEWRDLNPRPLGPEPSTLPSALHPDNICCTQLFYTGCRWLSNKIRSFLLNNC